MSWLHNYIWKKYVTCMPFAHQGIWKVQSVIRYPVVLATWSNFRCILISDSVRGDLSLTFCHGRPCIWKMGIFYTLSCVSLPLEFPHWSLRVQFFIQERETNNSSDITVGIMAKNIKLELKKTNKNGIFNDNSSTEMCLQSSDLSREFLFW